MANDTKHSAPTEDVSNGPTVEVTTADELEVRHASNAADEDEEINADTAGIVSAQPPPKKPKNKKKSGNPGSKRGLNAPTGFEEYHADAPLTPAEYEEERQIYEPSLPFTERMQIGIQRFEHRRKMSPEMLNIFYKYLMYGGVTVGPKMFLGGISKGDMEGMDKDQIVEAMAQTSIKADKVDTVTNNSAWAVDFEGVMKGFLSRRAPYYFGFEIRSQVDTVTRVLSNFMNYLLHHDVCPEYATDVLAARNVCNTASAELWACAEAQRWLPGDFNIACSTLFDGSYDGMYDGVTSWMPEDSGYRGFVGMTDDIAREVQKFAIAGAASEEIYHAWYRMAMENSIRVVDVRRAVGFEIIAIDQVDPETKQFYKDQSTEYRPVGKIRAKPWTNPDAPPEDLTVEEKEELKMQTKDGASGTRSADRTNSPDIFYEFFIEEVVLQHLFVGMKIEATVRKLNCGIWFFDEMSRAFCSFDTYLCNELMIGWKESRPVVEARGDKEDDVGSTQVGL